MKILQRTKHDPPCYIGVTDTLSLLWNDRVIMTQQAGRAYVVTESVIFELEPGDVLGDSGIGGAFIERD